MREFEEMAFVKDRYFNLKLRVLSHPKCIVRSDTGEIELRFGIPKKLTLNVDFRFLMFKIDKDEKETRSVEKFCLSVSSYYMCTSITDTFAL